MIDLPKLKEVAVTPTEREEKRSSWQRFVVGTLFVSIGAVAAAVGVASIGHRLTHIVVDNGLINARIVRLQAPVAGSVKALYARPGTLFRTGQVLARIAVGRVLEEEQLRLQLERYRDDQIRSQLERVQLAGELQANSAQLAAAKQSLMFLRQQLQNLDSQSTAVQGVDVAIASEALSQKQAALEAATAKADAASSDYERYRPLDAVGAISSQKTAQLRYTWRAAQAEVAQAKAELRSAQAYLNAAKKGVAQNNQNTMGGTLASQRAQLLQSIQAQSVLIKTLEAQVASSSNRFKQTQALYQNRQSWLNARQDPNRQPEFQVMSAPFSGVVYSTEREQGEQVNQLEPVLTLLDCNDLWIETVVRADEANRIDTQKPVSVHLSGYTNAVTGEVDLIQPISSIQGVEERSKLMQVQALLPAIPAALVGQPLVRVTVRIPPPPEHEQSQRFCGIGQAVSLTFSKKTAGSI